MLLDRDGYLWVGTQIGLNRMDPATGLFTRYLADGEPHSLSHDYVYGIYDEDESCR